MTRLGFWLVLLVPGCLSAQHTLDTSTQQKFISGGTIRLHRSCFSKLRIFGLAPTAAGSWL